MPACRRSSALARARRRRGACADGRERRGKSTLIKILAGAVRADSARIAIDGNEVTLDGPACRLAAWAALHPPGAERRPAAFGRGKHLPRPALSQALRRAGRLEGDRRARAAGALARLKITGIKPRRKMARLSSGDQMLVRIASLLDSGGARARPSLRHGRADRGVDRRKRAAVRRDRELRRRALHPLRLPPHGRGDAALRPHHGHARRPVVERCRRARPARRRSSA